MPAPRLIRAVPRTRGPAHLPRSLPAGQRTLQLSRPYQSTIEAGANGATVTTANSGGQVAGGYDDPFNLFSNNLPTFDNAHAHHGSLALKFTQPSGSTNANSAGWARLANPPGMPSFARVYLFMTANPSQVVQLIRFSDAAGTLIGGVRLTTTGTLVCLKASNAIVGSSSPALPLNAWIRVEARCLPSTVAGVGEIECRIWSTNAESAGAADTTLNNTGVASLGGNTVDRFEWGIAANPAAFTVTWNLWVDDVVGNATTWPGPAIVAGAIINIGVADNAFTGGLFPSLTLKPSTSLLPSSASGGMSDSVGAVKTAGGGTTFSRTATDTGATISDTVSIRHTPLVADTGVSVSDSVATIRVHLISDTAATVSDVVATNRARPLADTGASVSDSVATRRTHLVADTGATVTDAVATIRVHGVADTGATVTDSVATNRTRVLADTGATISDSVVGGRGFARALADTGATNTDSVATVRVHQVADTGASISDAVATKRARPLVDTGATISDSVVGGRGFTRTASDTGATVSDSTATLRLHFIVDTGTSISDQVVRRAGRLVSDTATTMSDSVATAGIHFRGVVDTAVVFSDSVGQLVRRGRAISDTATSITDSVTFSVIIGSRFQTGAASGVPRSGAAASGIPSGRAIVASGVPRN